jgi:hypothetical protein
MGNGYKQYQMEPGQNSGDQSEGISTGEMQIGRNCFRFFSVIFFAGEGDMELDQKVRNQKQFSGFVFISGLLRSDERLASIDIGCSGSDFRETMVSGGIRLVAKLGQSRDRFIDAILRIRPALFPLSRVQPIAV